MAELRLTASKALADEYRSLLRQEWSAETLLRATGLVAKLLRASERGTTATALGSMAEAAGRFRPDAQVAAALGGFLDSLFEEGAVPPVDRLPIRRSPAKARLAQAAELSWRILTLQYLASRVAQVRLTGDVDFLRDCQSLVFQLDLLFLLPDLDRHGMNLEHDFLLKAMEAHLALVRRREVAHGAYLSGVLFEYLGEAELAESALAAAFQATSPGNHDYLTKAHLVWFNLLDAGKAHEAKNFCLQLYRSSPPELLPEIGEMLDQTFSVPARKRATA